MRPLSAIVLSGVLLACPCLANAQCASLEALLAAAPRQEAAVVATPQGRPDEAAARRSGVQDIRREIPGTRLGIVVSVLQRISAAASLQPRLGLCRSDAPNAVALAPGPATGPNGAILITTGLLKLLGADEPAVASVFAHEFAHLIEEHSVQATQYARQVAGASIATGVRAGLQAGGDAGIASLVAKQVFLTHVASFRRDLERKADATGYQLYASARYDPRGATRALEKLRAARGEGSQSYLASHPGVSERIGLVTEIARDDVARVQRVEASRSLDAANEPYRAAAEELLAARKLRELSVLVGDWLRAVPESSAGWYYRGLLMKTARAGTATSWEAFERSVALDPSNGTAWLELAKSLWAAGYKAESVACAWAMQGMPELAELRKALPETHVLLHGRASSGPQNLWWTREPDGRKLITNDRQVLESRGLPVDRIPPPWVPIAR